MTITRVMLLDILDKIIYRSKTLFVSTVEQSVQAQMEGQFIGAIWVAQLDFEGDIAVTVEVPVELQPAACQRLARSICSRIALEHRLPVERVNLVADGLLPRQHDGTVDRVETSRRFRHGGFQCLYTSCLPSATQGEPLRVRDAAPKLDGNLVRGVDAIRRAVARLLEIEPDEIEDDDDLAYYGLDSIRIMSLAGEWRRQGVEVRFAELIAQPTVASWAALIDARVETQPEDGGFSSSLIEETGPFPLTEVQYAYWIGRSDQQILGGVGCHFYAEIDGQEIDGGKLEAALRQLFMRHDLLRARFLDDGSQEIMPTPTWRGLTLYELSDAQPAQAHEELRVLRQRLSHRRLEVERGEVFNVALSRLPNGAYRLHLNVDLLVADVASIKILLDELALLYAAPDTVLPPINYSFARYQTERLPARAAARERGRGYWRNRLHTMPGSPEIPLAIAPKELNGSTPERRRRCHIVPPPVRERLKAAAKRHGLTLAMALAAAFSEVLGQWSAKADFLLNVPVFNRESIDPDVPRLVADFTNILILEVRTGEDVGFAARAAELQTQFRRDIAHGAYSGVDVLRDLARARGSDSLMAPVVFTSALGMGDLFTPDFQATLGTPGWMISQAPQVWLDHQVLEEGGGLRLNWDAVEALFPAGLLDAMFEAYVGLLESLAAEDADWERPVPSLLPANQAAVRACVNATGVAWEPGLLHDGFFAQATAAPAAPALLWGADGCISYGALAERALRIAALLGGAGVESGELVAVSLPKGPEQIAAVLGILAAGAAYVPIGVDQPSQRRALIHERASIKVVLSDAVQASSLAWPEGSQLLTVSAAAETAPLASPVPVDPQALAYVIFTSGSTGTPKGVEIAHQAALNTIEDINARFAISPGDRVLAVSALDFDLSVFDVFGLLGAGGALVLIEEEERREAQRWAALVKRHEVTVWNSVPALLDMLLTAAGPSGLASLRMALVSGDWVGIDLPARLQTVAPNARPLVALGGATETSIWSNAIEVAQVPPAWHSIPYGFPLRNQAYRVVDARGQDCPDWVPGELWIGGVGVALGYRGEPELTAERFVLHNDGTRWYRTGDYGRYWPDGTLEFLGREDTQVKIRGHRLELGEVEAAIQAQPGVARAAVCATSDRNRRLWAFLVPEPEAVIDEASLRETLRHRLAEHAVPDGFIHLSSLPLTTNGKLDRKTLQAQADAVPIQKDTNTPPQEPIEIVIAQIWQNLLAVEQVGREDGFFALGGNSLTATRFITELQAQGIEGAELANLFATPILSEFARGLQPGRRVQARTIEPDPANRYEPFEPTEVQRAYWLGRRDDFDLGGVSCHFYTELEGWDVNLARLEEAWNRLIERHEMLRAVFDADSRQRILKTVPRMTIPVVAAVGSKTALDVMRAEMSHQLIDATNWPVFDVRAAPMHDGRMRIGVSLDNMILDAMSAMIVFNELALLYEDLEIELPPVGVSFRDYCLQALPDEATLAAAQAYWSDRVKSLPPPRLPLAVEPANVGRPHFVRREAFLRSETWKRLTERVREANLTPSSLVATVFAETLAAWCGQDQLTLNLTLFDRRDFHPDVNNILGDFTSLMLVAYQPEGGSGWRDRARRLQQQIARDLEHSAVSAVWVMRELARQSGMVEATMPVVFTSTIGIADALPQPSCQVYAERVWGITQTPQVWLDHQVLEEGGGLRLNWDAVEALFPAGLLDAMFEAYVGLLESLAAEDADWERPVPSLLPANQAAVRACVNATGVAWEPGLLHDGFFAQATAAPAAPALLWGADGCISYGALAERALRIAALLGGAGVESGELVAVSLPKGPEQIAAVLGILAAGAAYVPIGVDQPSQRRALIHERASIKVVLSDAVQASSLAWPEGSQLLTVSAAAETAPLASPVPVDPQALAYVIFTSGSTGTPKGVEIAHQAALNTIEDINARFAISPGDRVLAVSALDFDLSVFDVFGLLGAGGALVLIEEEERREAQRWAALVKRHEVTVWNSVPALLDMLLTAAGPSGLASLRMALVSGDWVGIDLPARLQTVAPNARPLVALGGATETSIWSNAIEVAQVPPAWHSIPYGFPLRNQAYRVVDARGQDCPDWVPGELWIGGVGVALGYRGEPELTAERFVLHNDGTRWYRTGDYGRYWPDGTLEFLGREDTQVKIRGHRLELGEVEAAIQAQPGVARAAVCATSDRNRRLWAFLVPEPEAVIDEASLRETLRHRLAEHAVPDGFIHLSSLPLTTNGKLDRKTLQAQADAVPIQKDTNTPPQGPIEIAIAQIWQNLLAVEQVGREDGFIALGGNSLLAIRFVQRLHTDLGVDFALRDVFTAGTLAKVAALAGEQIEEREEELTEKTEEGVL